MSTEYISPEYLNLQKELHQNPGYGVASKNYAALIFQSMQRSKTQSLLDYGAGKGLLYDVLTQMGCTVPYQGYDPAVERFMKRPDPAEMVVCLDVLEHIEEDRIDVVIKDIAAHALKEMILTVATYPAVKTLADGRNAHILLRDPDWWFAKIWQHMEILNLRTMRVARPDKKFGHTVLFHCQNW